MTVGSPSGAAPAAQRGRVPIPGADASGRLHGGESRHRVRRGVPERHHHPVPRPSPDRLGARRAPSSSCSPQPNATSRQRRHSHGAWTTPTSQPSPAARATDSTGPCTCSPRDTPRSRDADTQHVLILRYFPMVDGQAPVTSRVAMDSILRVATPWTVRAGNGFSPLSTVRRHRTLILLSQAVYKRREIHDDDNPCDHPGSGRMPLPPAQRKPIVTPSGPRHMQNLVDDPPEPPPATRDKLDHSQDRVA